MTSNRESHGDLVGDRPGLNRPAIDDGEGAGGRNGNKRKGETGQKRRGDEHTRRARVHHGVDGHSSSAISYHRFEDEVSFGVGLWRGG